MAEDNLDRMIALAEGFFGTRNDPAQISVNEEVMERLKAIHPNTLSEERDKNGPVAWILLLPTTHGLMQQFVEQKVTEKELLDLTSPGETYDALYLCSALVLPEHRGKGIAKCLASNTITEIQKYRNNTRLSHFLFGSLVLRENALPNRLLKNFTCRCIKGNLVDVCIFFQYVTFHKV